MLEEITVTQNFKKSATIIIIVVYTQAVNLSFLIQVGCFS